MSISFLSVAMVVPLIVAAMTPVEQSAQLFGITRRLQSMDGFTRGAAARELAQLGPSAETPIPQLIDILRSSPRDSAAEALGRLGGAATQAVAALSEALEDEEDGVRRTSAEALGRIGPSAAYAVPALTRALRDRDYRVRKEAAVALGKIEGRTALLLAELESPHEKQREEAAELLGRIGERNVPDLLKALRSPRPTVRAAAASALGKVEPVQPSLVPIICGLLKDSRPQVRASAASALGQMGPAARDCLPDLIAALRRQDCAHKDVGGVFCLGSDCPEVEPNALACLAAVFAMEKLAKRCAACVSELSSAVADVDFAVAATAAKSLGHTHPSALPVLTKALGDDRVEVRHGAVEGLGVLGPEAVPAVPALVDALSRTTDDEDGTRQVIGDVLARIGGAAAAEALVPILERSVPAAVKQSATRILGEIGPPAGVAIPALVKLADRGSFDAAVALRKIGSAEAIPPLLRMLSDRDGPVRDLAAKELGALGPTASVAVPTLTGILAAESVEKTGIERVRSRELRSAVAAALAKLGPEGVKAILAALESPDKDFRSELLLAMWGLGPGAELALPRLLELSKDSGLRERAAYAMASAGVAAVPQLIAALADPTTTQQAVEALRQMLPRTTPVPALIAALESGPLLARKGAVLTLTEIGPEASAAAPVLASLLSDGREEAELRKWIPSALVKIGDVGTFPALVKALDDASRDVRMNAVEAMARAGPVSKTVVLRLASLLSDADEDIRRKAVTTLKAMGKLAEEAIPIIVGLLQDPRSSPRERHWAAEILGAMGATARSAAGPLAAALRDPQHEVRSAAASALGDMGTGAADAVPHLLEGLTSKDDAVLRELAVRVCRWNRPAAERAAAQLAMAMREPRLREGAIEALNGLGEAAVDAVEPLIEGLQNEDEKLRSETARLLGTIGPLAKSAVPGLIGALAKDRSMVVRQNAAVALGDIARRDDRVGRALTAVAAMRSEVVDVRVSAIASLARIRWPSAVRALIGLLKDPETRVRCAAAASLGGFGPHARSAAPRLKLLLEQPRGCWPEGVRASLRSILEI